MPGSKEQAAPNAPSAVWLAVALLWACGPTGGEPPTDAGPDVGPDVDAADDDAPDADAGMEDGPESDDGTDAGTDDGPDAGYCESWACWTVPPTGQSTCYDNTSALADCPGGTDPPSCGAPALPFCGQDAQYRDVERTWTCRSAEGALVPCSTLPTVVDGETVDDSLTGLAWQRAFATGVPWTSAADTCTALNGSGGPAGRTDWRLPGIYELATLIDLGRVGPAIDTAAFPGTPDAPGWWSATPDALRSEVAWGVGFASGDVNEGPVSMPAFVRCVAGPPLEVAEGPGRFDAGDDPSGTVVVDRATGLAWHTDVAPILRWADALVRCEDLVAGGADDWRLPSATELRSLVRVDLAGAKSSFPGITTDCFWSSTTSTGDPTAAWVVSFASGHGFTVGKPTTFSALCVRGAP